MLEVEFHERSYYYLNKWTQFVVKCQEIWVFFHINCFFPSSKLVTFQISSNNLKVDPIASYWTNPNELSPKMRMYKKKDKEFENILFERNGAPNFGKGGNGRFKLLKLKSHTLLKSKFEFVLENDFGNGPLSLLCETFKIWKLEDSFQNHLGNESEMPL